MSVCQRSNGKWVVKYKDVASGQWKQRQFKEETAAREFDAAATQEAESLRPLSLRECVTAYVQNRNLCWQRVWLYDYLVNGHDRKDGTHTTGPAEHLADRYVASLKRQDLESVRNNIRAAGRKPITINTQVGMLKAALNWAASEDLIELNPWAKYRNVPTGQARHLSGTMEELQQVLPHLPEWMQWATATAMALCLRPGLHELFALKWEAFDWKTTTATVYMPKVKTTKHVFIPEWYRPLAQARQRQYETREAFVCSGPDGRPVVSQETYRAPWKRACKQAGVSIPFYSVRHIAASEMLAAGADLAAVAAQLGHRNITTTGSFYTHAVARAQARAAATIPMVDLVAVGGEARV